MPRASIPLPTKCPPRTQSHLRPRARPPRHSSASRCLRRQAARGILHPARHGGPCRRLPHRGRRALEGQQPRQGRPVADATKLLARYDLLDDPAATGTELPLAATKTGKPPQATSNNIDLDKQSATVRVHDEGNTPIYVQLGQ